MDSCKAPKRLLELESCASAQQTETDRVEVKRQRVVTETTEDEFEEFVALLDRIRYMKTKHKEISMGGNSDVKGNNSKSPCIPSFEWEDFCVSAAKEPMSAQRDIYSLPAEDNPSSSEEKGKQSSQPASKPKMGSSSDAYVKSPAESFDLNVEAS